ncbi:hypothetical protein BGW42_008509 [Actinomortierella wolfii]|nr:hypothetical protein BGW42_008509 [Actinomortierella wolfii]
MHSSKDPLSPEAVWCAQRIKDAIQIGYCHYDGPQQLSTISTGTIESKTLVDQCLKHFALDRRAYNETLADEITRSASIVLTTMEKRLSIEQSDGDLKTMACWTLNLSSLCAPMISEGRLFDLSQQLLSVAKQISHHDQRISNANGRAKRLQCLCKPFVEQVSWSFDQQDCKISQEESKSLLFFLWDEYEASFDIGLLAFLDKTMELTFKGSVPSWPKTSRSGLEKHDIETITKYLDSSRWLNAVLSDPKRPACPLSSAIVNTSARERPCSLHGTRRNECALDKLLQGLAKTASQISDWRVVRLCILVLCYCFDTLFATASTRSDSTAPALGKGGASVDSLPKASCHSRLQALLDVVQVHWNRPLSADRYLLKNSTQLPPVLPHPSTDNNPTAAATVSWLREIRQAAQIYMYADGGPDTIVDRQHIVFLLMTTMATHHYHWLRMLHTYLTSPLEDEPLCSAIAHWMHWMLFATDTETLVPPTDEAERACNGKEGGSATSPSSLPSGILLNLLLRAARARVRSSIQESGPSRPHSHVDRASDDDDMNLDPEKTRTFFHDKRERKPPLQQQQQQQHTLTYLEAVVHEYRSILALNPVVLADFVLALAFSAKECFSANALLRLTKVVCSGTIDTNSPILIRWLDILGCYKTPWSHQVLSPDQAIQITQALFVAIEHDNEKD